MDALPGYTPVRRRPQSPFGNLSPAHAQVPWTTARCNRLLRPIASRILLLRKSNNTKPAVPVTETSISQSPGHVGRSRKTAPSQDCSPIRCRAPAQTGVKGDPEWVPSAVMRRRVKHKYSSRTTANKVPKRNCEEGRSAPCSLPGEVMIATPIITQKARPYTTAPEGGGDAVAQDREWESGDHVAEGRKRRKLQNCPSRRCEADPVPHDMRQKLKKVVAPARWMLIDGLYNGLDALLKGTEKSTRPQSCGARSLFSLCLRRVPDYIATEQAWLESRDDDDEIDVCSEVYNVLEDMSSTRTEGWKPLREVVRAHGVAMLSDAIREGLIDHVVGRGLVFLCIHALAFGEAEVLLDALISSLRPAARPSSVYSKLFDGDATACLGTLDVFASRSGRHGFQYRQLEKLLRGRTVPIEWVATTEFAPTWGRVVQSISHGDHDYGDAARLLITAVMLACGPADHSVSDLTQELRLCWHKEQRLTIAEPTMPVAERLTRIRDGDAGLSSALNNTISSLMAIMYAISMTQRDKSQQDLAFGPPDSNGTAFALLESLNVDLLREWEVNDDTARNDYTATICRQRRVTVLLALLLLVQEWQGHQENFPDPGSARTLGNIAALSMLCEHHALEAASQVASMVSSIARCCAKAAPGQEFDHVQKLTRYLASIASDEGASTASRQLFACFASTTAMNYAQESRDTVHIEWALEMEERVMKESRAFAHNLAKTPLKGNANPPQGYRWEEGICEWIAKTPKIRSEEHSVSSELSDILSKAHRKTCWQRHRETSPVDLPFGLSGPLPTGSEKTLQVPSSRGSNPAVNRLAKQNGTHISTSQPGNTPNHIIHVRPVGQGLLQRRPPHQVLHDAGPTGSCRMHVDNDEDELSASDSLREPAKPPGSKLGITSALGSTRHSRHKGPRQAIRSSQCQPLRFQQGPRRPEVARVWLEEESEDELGM